MLWKYGFDMALELETGAYNSTLERKPDEEVQVRGLSVERRCQLSAAVSWAPLAWGGTHLQRGHGTEVLSFLAYIHMSSEHGWPGAVWQLSPHGKDMLTRWFTIHDLNRDKLLDRGELQSFFGPLGDEAPHPFAQVGS
jgi:hypothetical protein